ncbi:MAG: hypothetical protein KZQ77_11165, partial [Candidatus Thiodiazotropha sp. (ex Notomyrtea botanica)]|nr:hypothetical protein [Candidatus Thiodiazotropha sp. (ex Notomyrtea botanica)]
MAIFSICPVHGEDLQRIDQGLNWNYCNPAGPTHNLASPSPPLSIDKPQIEADEMQFNQGENLGLLLGSVQLWQSG